MSDKPFDKAQTEAALRCDASGRPPVVFSNRIAAFLWGFTLIWLFLLVLFTSLLVRGGPPEGYSIEVSWAVMMFFWLGGGGLICYALSKPCYFVTVDRSGTVCFTWQYPHRRRRTEVSSRELAPPYVVDSEDDEGSPYYIARLDLPDGKVFRLAEGHARPTCEEACLRFTSALRAIGT